MRVGAIVLSLAVVTAAALSSPAATRASCLPVEFRTFGEEPGSVVVTGTVTQVNVAEVLVDVQLWWGENPQRTIVVRRPPHDPAVITSVDWNPQPNEVWVILGTREGPALQTGACAQFPATEDTVREVVSSLGEGTVPVATEPPSPNGGNQAESSANAGLWVGLGALIVIAGAGIVGWWLIRRRATTAGPRF